MGAVSTCSYHSTGAIFEPGTDFKIPRHIAVIMDGNRRYGRYKYGSGSRGHTDGTKTVMEFTNWCIDAGIKALTVFAFSTENWKREKAEIDTLMKLIDGFINNILGEALTRNIRVQILTSDSRQLPDFLVHSIRDIETKTQNCTAFNLNLCVSYGGRDEIITACKNIATEVAQGKTSVDDINEEMMSQRMLTAGLPDPDIVIRTSGECRLSNFLLFQIAYAELIFMDKFWPEMTREDLQEVIREFNRRKRRFGK